MPYVTSVSLFMICAGLTLPRSSGLSFPRSHFLSLESILTFSCRLFFILLFHALVYLCFAVSFVHFHPWHRLRLMASPHSTDRHDLLQRSWIPFRKQWQRTR